ncbi:MAG: hypothetical protein JWM48_2569 [Mycobacterium sp.]|nr:hypothetical protein [Mycobacterium sp.]
MPEDRRPPQRAGASARSATGLAVLLVGAGVLHGLVPRPYAAILPRFLGAPRAWVYGSGAAELAVGAAVARPATRRLGGLAAAALFVVVFPANVTMAVRAFRSRRGPVVTAVALLRLPLQYPLVRWALAVSRADGAA